MAKAGKNPSCTWFWKDYQDDPELRTVSLAAQGLWMRMLCLASRAQPAGHVTMGEQPLTSETIIEPLARLVGSDKETVRNLVSEIITAGVCSVSKTGIIYCRRMVKAANTSKERAKAGAKGASVTNGQKREKAGLSRQNSGKGAGKVSASGTRLLSPISINPLNPPDPGGPELGDGKGGQTPDVIGGVSVAELRVKAGALERGGAGCEVIARNLGDAMLRAMVAAGLLSPEVAARYGIKPRKAT